MLSDVKWPDLSDPRYAEATERVRRSGVLSLGPEVRALEEEAATFFQTEDAAAVSSGTSAITLALRALGVGPGDRVVVPAYGWVATAIAVLHAGAEVVWADVGEDYCVTPETLYGPATNARAVILVHLHGFPVDVAAIQKELPYGCLLLEDACQAPGATRDGMVGGLADAGIVSLNQTKALAAGEGGLVMGNRTLAERVRELRVTTRPGEDGRVAVEASYNAKLPELVAAYARTSLALLPARNEKARENALLMNAELAEVPGVRTPTPLVGHTYHKYRVAVPRALGEGPWYRWQDRPLTRHPLFGWQGTLYPGAEYAATATYVLGSEDRPLCHVSADEALGWARQLREELSDG